MLTGRPCIRFGVARAARLGFTKRMDQEHVIILGPRKGCAGSISEVPDPRLLATAPAHGGQP